MVPILLEINGLPIYAHGFFLNLALLVCLLFVVGEVRRRRWPKGEVLPKRSMNPPGRNLNVWRKTFGRVAT